MQEDVTLYFKVAYSTSTAVEYSRGTALVLLQYGTGGTIVKIIPHSMITSSMNHSSMIINDRLS